jgi:hypothetical protein
MPTVSESLVKLSTAFHPFGDKRKLLEDRLGSGPERALVCWRIRAAVDDFSRPGKPQTGKTRWKMVYLVRSGHRKCFLQSLDKRTSFFRLNLAVPCKMFSESDEVHKSKASVEHSFVGRVHIHTNGRLRFIHFASMIEIRSVHQRPK